MGSRGGVWRSPNNNNKIKTPQRFDIKTKSQHHHHNNNNNNELSEHKIKKFGDFFRKTHTHTHAMWVLLLPQCVAYLARTNVILPIVIFGTTQDSSWLSQHTINSTPLNLYMLLFVCCCCCFCLQLFLFPLHMFHNLFVHVLLLFLVVIVIRLWVVGQCMLVNRYDDNYLISCFTTSTNCIDIWILSSIGGTLYINQYRLGSGNDAEIRKACSYSWVVDTNSEGSLSTGVIVRDLNL